MAEVMSVLYFHTMRYKLSAPRDPSSDRFILSKGHAAPILYAGIKAVDSFYESPLEIAVLAILFRGWRITCFELADIGYLKLGSSAVLYCVMREFNL